MLVYEPNTHCSELFNAIKSARGQDGRLISEALQRAPSRRNDPAFHNAIERPMDLSRINQKLNADEYNSLGEMCADIELLIENTLSFYKPDAPEFLSASELKRERERTESRTERMSEGSSATTGSSKRDADMPPPRPQEWKMEAAICWILGESDSEGRILSTPFAVLPSKEAFPVYYETVKNPIDLKTIARKARNDEYATWAAFGDDLKLMFRNAKAFNKADSVIYGDAMYLNTKVVKNFGHWNKSSPTSRRPRRPRPKRRRATRTSEDEATLAADSPPAKLYAAARQSEFATHFLTLPDKTYYPDYYEDISTPISLFLVNKRLKQEKYPTVAQLAADLQLMCKNAMTYNVEGSEIYEHAVGLDALVIQKTKELDPSVHLTPTFVEPEAVEPPIHGHLRSAPARSACSSTSRSPRPPPAPSDTMQSFAHKPSIGSDDGTNQSDTTIGNDGSGKRKKKARTAAQPSAGRTWARSCGPVGKSFNELRELYKMKLLDVYTTVDGRKLAEPFMFRPDPHIYPDYYTEIENPIDMTMIRHRIESGEYKTSEDFTDDFRLLFRNARRYNREDSQIYADSKALEQVVINTVMAITNNTVLYYPPPSKRRPNFFTEMGSAALHLEDERRRLEQKTPARPAVQATPLQVKMTEVLDRICDFQNGQGRVLSTLFQRLPSKQEYPDYYEVIKKPIDLLKIRQKINANQYNSQKTFFADLKLVFDNATKYNEPESEIYKDALMLKNEVMDVCAEDHDDDDNPSVQMQVRRILTNLLVAVNTYTIRNRCLSDSFTEVTSLFRKAGIPVHEMAFTLDQIKMNLDKGRYKRLDRFQDDVFALFSRVRALTRPETQTFLDSVDLQKFFISKREELCKGILISPASTFTESSLWDEVEARKKAAKREKSPSAAENEGESDADRSKGSEESEEGEKAKEAAEETIETAEHEGVTYKADEFVYVAPGEDNVPDPTQRHILRVERIVRDGEGADEILVKGFWVFKPQETYHLATRKFFEKEVFITPNRASVSLDRLRGKCCVLHLDDYLRSKPKDFDEQDVFVCEYKYLGRKLHFKRFTVWPYAEEVKAMEMEERPEDFNPPKSVIKIKEPIEREHSATPIQPRAASEEADVDERMRDLPNVLDVHREEVAFGRPQVPEEGEAEEVKGEPGAPEVVYFEQVNLNGAFYRIGDCVFVFNPRKPHCDVMRIDRIWQTPDGQRHFSGMFFARPIELQRGSNSTFYKREVIAVEQRDRAELLERVQGRCAVMTTKQFITCRPTEVPECDVFVVDKIVSGDPREPENFLNYATAKPMRKLKTYNWTDAVPDDELFYFKKPLEMERRPEPLESKVDAMLPIALEDIDQEETMLTEQQENPAAPKETTWLASQPKLNAKSKSGYILFSAEIRKRVQHENPEAGFGEVSKLVGLEWKKLNDEQKKQFEARATMIAEERTKQDALGPANTLQPGEMRIFVCRWHGCDYQFDHYDGLFDHLRTSHASSEDTKVKEDNETHFVCLWMTCVKYRANGKPFPTLNRLLRHIREKHMPSSGKIVNPNQRGKHFFHYIPQDGPVRDNNPQGLFVSQPNGKSIPNASAHRTATPWDPKSQPSVPTSPVTSGHPPVPSTPNPQTPHATPVPQASAASTPQVHYVQHAQPASQAGPQVGAPAQVVQVVNGSSVAYVNSPYQTVIVNQPPAGQILVQHAVGQPLHPGTPHQIVVHGAPPPTPGGQLNGIQPGQNYAAHPAPGTVHVYASSSTATPVHSQSNGIAYYTPGQPTAAPYALPQSSAHAAPVYLSNADASRMIVNAPHRPEPLFVPPPQSIKTKRVLHSEAYLRYIESLSQTRQRAVSRYDHNLARTQQTSAVPDKRKLPADWIDKESSGKKREEEVGDPQEQI
ncbi:hypothetical protein M3Y99_00367700 [Aphelenchoides fujianensis]|nr:hypothetical protein M3Y99_00367700 [Aphelenchoides fujianensis]